MARVLVLLFCVFSLLNSSYALDINSIALKLEKRYAVPERYTRYVLSHAKVVPSVKEFALRVAHAPETVMPFDRFMRLFVNDKRIFEGVEFFKEHKKLLFEVEKRFGVNPCVVVAILSIETDFGRVKLKNNCLNSLYSLALYSRRRQYFLSELESYIVYTYRHKIDPFKVKGSITCALGIAQFMPSNVDRYGVDFNGDGLSLDELPDAVASVANYLKKHGWITGGRVLERLRNCKGKSEKILKLKNSKERFVCFRVYKNFWVLKSYNGTINYALAAYTLASKICNSVKAK